MAPTLCSSDATLLLLDRYDASYGICNHDLVDFDRPLSIVGMHPAEDTSNGSMMYERISLFAQLQVAKFFGLSLKEFFEFPPDVVTHILETASKMQANEGNTASGILDQLNGN